MIKAKKNLGYTEKLVRNVLVMCWASIFLAIMYAFQYQGTEVWVSILDVVKYLSVSTVGFFVWKARSENIIKISNNPDFEIEDYTQRVMEQINEDFIQETVNLDKENYL